MLLPFKSIEIVEVPLTVQVALYATGDIMGGKIVIPVPKDTLTRVTKGVILDVRLMDQAATAGPFDMVIFRADPTGTTFTENSPLDIADADLNKVVGTVSFPVAARMAFVDNAVHTATELGTVTINPPSLFFVLPVDAVNLYAGLFARFGPTPAATTDFSLLFTIGTY